MRKLIPYSTALIAVSLIFLVVACSKYNSQTGSNRSQSNMSNSDVEKTIQDRFKADPQLSAFDIKVSADSNEVKLSGTVNSEEARNRAIQIAQDALPGFAISNSIDVKPGALARSEEQSSRDLNQNPSPAR